MRIINKRSELKSLTKKCILKMYKKENNELTYFTYVSTHKFIKCVIISLYNLLNLNLN